MDTAIGLDVEGIVGSAYLAHSGPLQRYLTSITRDPAAAEDLTHDAFERLTTEARAGRVPDDINAWLHRVLVRCVYREANRERRQTVRAAAVGEISAYPDASRDVEDRDALDRGFRRLRSDHRAVLVLHHYLGLSDDEAATVLSVPTGTFKSRLNRATSALRSELDADARSADRLATESVR